METVQAPAVTSRLERLRACWHGAAYARDVGTTPYRTELLGERLVIWRDSRGTPHAFRDLCIHRGTALSLGSVAGDEIVCAYHGWRYAVDGRCTAIPQLDDPTRVPAKACVAAYQCRERYGLVWVALAEPRWAIPDLPELESAGWKTVFCGPYTLESEASRQIENFTDLAHFPWVHPGLLGDPSRVKVVAPEVRTEGHVLHYEFQRPEAKSTSQYPVFPNEQRENSIRRTRYELRLPYTIVVHMDWGGPEKLIYLFVSQPITAERLLPDRPELQPRPVRPRVPGVRGCNLRTGLPHSGVATPRTGPLRPRRGAPSEVRLRRRRLPARDERSRPRVTSSPPDA